MTQIVLALFLLPAALAAQDPPAGDLAASGPAAARAAGAAVEAARDAQRRFEWTRIRHLPWAWHGPRGECDEVVGRFCFRFEPGASWTPPPEAPEIARARERLLADLAAAAREAPGDGWIAGQRVRYLVEAGRAGDAARVARACGAETWWCRALLGFARHAAGDVPAAERAFAAARAAMAPARRGAWDDPSLLLESDLRRFRDGLGPAAREAFDRRLWWLADPLWSEPGNARRSEHDARRVAIRMADGTATPYAIRWGGDLAELTLRYGWPAGWERVRDRPGALASPVVDVVGHDPPWSRRFLPSRAAFHDPAVAPAGAWRLDDPLPREAYAWAGADSVVPIDAQVAVFRRGGSAVVVGAWDLAVAGGSAATDGRLVVAASPDAAPRIARRAETRPHGAVSVRTPWAPAVASVEALSMEAGVAGRHRVGLPFVRPSGETRVSDLLLLDPGAPPATLEEAVDRARGTARVRGGETVGVYFEVYPPEGGPREVELAIRLRDERTGFWRRVGAALGMGGEPLAAGDLAWRETLAGRADVVPRAVQVALPDLGDGRYALVLEVAFADGRRARVERALTVGSRRGR